MSGKLHFVCFLCTKPFLTSKCTNLLFMLLLNATKNLSIEGVCKLNESESVSVFTYRVQSVSVS